MRVVVIGGTGHVCTYLVPRLVRAGHEVFAVSRGNREPYTPAPEWESVRRIRADRHAEDRADAFGPRIAQLKPDAVIDMICFDAGSARKPVEALPNGCLLYLSCGTIWVHGPAEVVPTPEDAPRSPIGSYGIRKNEMEQYLFDQAAAGGVPSTVIHPGHIVGPGWSPLNPQGHFDLSVWRTIARGEELLLPNLGLECVHHVHADDVAQVFKRALDRPQASAGEAFHAVSARALTLSGYARAAYGWFEQEPRLRFRPLEELESQIGEANFKNTVEHIRRSPCMSIEKARRLLGYEPGCDSLASCREAVDWLLRNGKIEGAPASS